MMGRGATLAHAGPAQRSVAISRRRLIAGAVLLLFFRRAEAWAKDPFETLQLFRPKRRVAAPDFTVPGLGSSLVRLRDFKGQVIVLNFWATWCPPCKEEMPSMERLHRRFRVQGFRIVAISIDADTPAVPPFVKHFGLTFPIGLDPKMEVATRYGLRGLPTTVLIDRGGRMVAFAFGPRDWDGAAGHTLIEGLLKQ